MTQWTITRDLLNERYGGRDDTGTSGPHDMTMSAGEIIKHPDAQPFKLYDDDGVCYYWGWLVGDDLFSPLDDFGKPNAGCTDVAVRQDGRWVRV